MTYLIDVRELALMAQGQGGVSASDLPPNAVLTIHLGDRKVEMSFGEDPKSGEVAVRSLEGGDWAIWLHMTKLWGSTVGPNILASKAHWLGPGNNLYVGPVFFPIIDKIVLQGLDLANPSTSQHQ